MTFAFTCRDDIALREWIPSETFYASANRQVIQHVALSIYAARAWARIHASLVHARKMTFALGAQNAFWSALRWHADVVWHTGARRIAGY